MLCCSTRAPASQESKRARNTPPSGATTASQCGVGSASRRGGRTCHRAPDRCLRAGPTRRRAAPPDAMHEPRTLSGGIRKAAEAPQSPASHKPHVVRGSPRIDCEKLRTLRGTPSTNLAILRRCTLRPEGGHNVDTTPHRPAHQHRGRRHGIRARRSRRRDVRVVASAVTPTSRSARGRCSACCWPIHRS